MHAAHAHAQIYGGRGMHVAALYYTGSTLTAILQVTVKQGIIEGKIDNWMAVIKL